MLGLKDLPDWLFFLFSGLWLLLALNLILGLMWLLWTTFWLDYPLSWNLIARWDFGFHIAQVAAFAAVLGAVIALPVTLTRLRLARESNTLAKDSLFNDKITEAAADLYAQRQVTRQKGEGFVNVWEDDIVRRNAAIDRLFGLVEERPSEANRVSRLLSVYLRELSREYPPQPAPSTSSMKEFEEWVTTLVPIRSDMENATQVLGRLSKSVVGVKPKDITIDLRHTNLQGMILRELNFEGAKFEQSNLQGTNFIGTNLNKADLYLSGLQGAYLKDATLIGSDLCGAKLDFTVAIAEAQISKTAAKFTDFSDTPDIKECLSEIFGDGTTQLNEKALRPSHWPTQALTWPVFYEEFEKWKSDPEGYVPPDPPAEDPMHD
ncbi:MAG: pentapeptide repeat-containing protein [Pelagimonas sp.]|nr:pentapeptide repeat-containing protein [Pelagimonas sp.]